MKSKRIAMLAFTWFCRLSDIMAAIAVFQRQSKFSRDWNGDNILDCSSELKSVKRLDQALETWKKDFEAAIIDVLGEDKPQIIPIPVAILQIISQ